MKTNHFLLIFSVIVLLCSCTPDKKFDRELWMSENQSLTFENRNAMVDDLMNNHHLKGKSVQELNAFFGYTVYDSTDNQSEITFEVYQEWDGIDPSYTKYLNLHLNANKIVDSVYLSEHHSH